MPTLHQPAPSFELPDQNGKFHRLEDYRGQKVLLYFYPKDDTPGCTVEAQCFRDRLNELKAKGVQVLGVSADSVKSHQRFVKKFSLNFPLLADSETTVCQAYGVWKEKSMFGKKFMGIQRDSFLIDEQGRLVQHYENVDPATHVDQVMAEL